MLPAVMRSDECHDGYGRVAIEETQSVDGLGRWLIVHDQVEPKCGVCGCELGYPQHAGDFDADAEWEQEQRWQTRSSCAACDQHPTAEVVWPARVEIEFRIGGGPLSMQFIRCAGLHQLSAETLPYLHLALTRASAWLAATHCAEAA